MPSALVVGGDSRIGQAVGGRLRDAGWQLLATTRRRERVGPNRPWLDLADRDLDAARLPSCDLCLLAGAVASLDSCRQAPETARRVNVDGAVAVARAVARRGAFVLLLSTNQVFDGTRPLRRTDEAVCPVSDYGRQKAAAESEILSLAELGGVVRLTKVLTPDAPLLQGWIADLRRGQTIRAFADLSIAPVTLDDAAAAIATLLRKRAAGIHHLSGDRDVAYADIARQLAALAGAAPEQIVAGSWREAGIAAEAAPACTTLDCSGLAAWAITAPATAACLAETLPLLINERT